MTPSPAVPQSIAAPATPPAEAAVPAVNKQTPGGIRYPHTNSAAALTPSPTATAPQPTEAPATRVMPAGPTAPNANRRTQSKFILVDGGIRHICIIKDEQCRY